MFRSALAASAELYARTVSLLLPLYLRLRLQNTCSLHVQRSSNAPPLCLWTNKAVVSPDGQVNHMEVAGGHPLLVNAAVGARLLPYQLWEYDKCYFGTL
jgi:hypothetical protein